MGITLLKCPSCGANLPPPATANAVIVCEYCHALLAASPTAAWPMAGRPIDDKPFDPKRPRVTLGGMRYALMGRLGQGAASDVFLARRDARITERVVLHALRAKDDEDLLARTFTQLQLLGASEAQGAEHFTRLLPQPVAKGTLSDAEGRAMPGAAYRYPDGFQHTFEAVRAAYPSGIEPAHAVWLWKRTLELLGWLHRAGWVHGAVLPSHLLVHPRDHGVILCGWSAVQRLAGARSLPSRSTADEAYYPDALWHGAVPSAMDDLVMSARAVALVLGAEPGRWTLPAAVPGPMRALVVAQSEGRRPGAYDDAWALRDRLDAVARECFGPPRFVKFAMPGWR